MEWIKLKDYNPDVHGTYLIVRMNSANPEFIMKAAYCKDGNSSKWWTSYPDGGLRTCGEPYEILIKCCLSTDETKAITHI